ncbi:hypothetical protein [Helicobacter brantae]|uniref:Uncharacterized protein n=1 Tax=Helicobacter brantae TaxID=375927 RepID=A0A3D8J125_9HELI|nr:hypothetical protein [Helicobacter brantae]RDU70906.1 hypothetical protein CQA58_03780 [Helicobacter brantae]
MKKSFLLFAFSILLANDDLSQIFKATIDKAPTLQVYCRPPLYYNKAPSKEFLKQTQAPKSYTYSQYAPMIYPLLDFKMPIKKTKNQVNKSVDMVFEFSDDMSFVFQSALSGEGGDRVVVDYQAYEIEREKMDLFLEVFCPMTKRFLKNSF